MRTIPICAGPSSLLFLALLLFGSASFCFAAASDAPIAWRQAIGGRILSEPISQAESVVVLCEDRSVRSYGRSGTALWRYEAGARLLPYLSRSREGTSYFSRIDGTLVALNRSGRELWTRLLNEPISAIPLVGYDGRIFAISNRTVYCFSAAGLLKWKRPLLSNVSCEPVLSAEGGPLIALGDGSVLRVSPFGETSTFFFDAAPRAITVQGERTLVGFGDGSIQEIMDGWASSGEFAQLGIGISALAADRTSVAYVLDNESTGMFDAQTGLNVWHGTVLKSRLRRLIIDERGLYVLGEKGSVAFSRDGRRLWSLNMDGASLPATLSEEGLLYSGGDDWILYAYRVEERVLADYSNISSNKGRSYALTVPEEPEIFPDPFAMEEANIQQRLDMIDEAILNREVGALEKANTLALIMIAGAELPKLGKRGPIAVLPHQRARAAYALGDLGSSEVLPFLTNIFRRDPESVVRAAAAEAIGAIGSDPDGHAMEAFAEAIFPPVPMRDERLLFSTASSIGALCRFSGPPLSDMGIRLLVSLSSPDRPSIVRSKAQRELALMMAK